MDNEIILTNSGKEIAAQPIQGNLDGFELDDARATIIPRILLCQRMSKLVAEEKAKPGDIVNNVTLEKLGAPGQKVEIVPLASKNIWLVFDKDRGNKFVKSIPVHEAPNLEYEGKLDGMNVKNDFTIVYWVLVLKNGVPDDMAQISFKGMSKDAAKRMGAVMKKDVELMRLPKFYRSFYLTCEQTQNEKGNFFIYKTEMGKPLTPELRETAQACAPKAAKAVVHGEEELEIEEHLVKENIAF